MAKLFQMHNIEASMYLYKNAYKRCWITGLADNRREKSYKEIGKIPFERRSGKVFYNNRDIESFAVAIKLHELFDQPFTKLF